MCRVLSVEGGPDETDILKNAKTSKPLQSKFLFLALSRIAHLPLQRAPYAEHPPPSVLMWTI